MKRLLLHVAVLSFLVQSIAFSGIANADQWNPFGQPPPPNQAGVAISEGSFLSDYSYFSNTSLLPNGDFQEAECATLGSTGSCTGQTPSVSDPTSFASVLPVCSDASEIDCIVSLSVGTSASTMVPSTFTGSAAGPSLSSDAALGVPTGGTASLWTNPTINAGGTNTYSVVADAIYEYDGPPGQFYPASSTGGFFAFQLNVLPYTLESSPFITAPTLESYTTPQGTVQKVFSTGAPSNCVWSGIGECGVAQDFALGTSVAVSIRLSNQIGGWYEARMQGTQVSVSKYSATSNVITVSGESVQVPQLAVTGPTSNSSIQAVCSCATVTPGLYSLILSTSPLGIIGVDDLRTLANNTATGTVNVWDFRTAASLGSPCVTDSSQVAGIVSTNAMATDGNAPTFENGFLTYSVAGMHYLPDGSLALGTYDLVIADSVARCLYGFSNAPISASISVSDDNGTENVATTSVTNQGGWLKLAAYGFTFSDPVIKVKLTQSAKLKKKVTLHCVRGATKKTVIGSSPKCPSGYKIA